MHNPNEDTELAHGILPPKPPSREPSPDIPHITHSDAIQAVAATADADQLALLLEGDGLDSDDERVFEEYRRRRVEQMRQAEKRGRFGSMEPLSREDFVKEVTEGSRLNSDGQVEETDEEDDEEGSKTELSNSLKGTGVVVFLYKDSVSLSQHLRPLLQRLAAAHPETKFLSIPAGMCIPYYPDKNVPTLLVYRNGNITGNVVAGQGLNGMKTTIRDLEMLLLRTRAVTGLSPALRERNEDDDSDEDLEKDVGFVNTQSTAIRGGAQAADSDDSDFDL